LHIIVIYSDFLLLHNCLYNTSLFVVVENDHAAAATSLTDDSRKCALVHNWSRLPETCSEVVSHEDLVRPKNIFPVRKKSPQKFTVLCIMFCLAFLECFTLVLAIGHLISPLVFIEVKVIKFLVFIII
jgi:hypothetical protein